MKKLAYLLLIVLLCYLFFVYAQQPSQSTGLEIPAIHKQDVIIKHLGYTLSYNEKHEQANWVAYQLTADETKKKVSRSNDFEPDESVATGSANGDDYKGSGFDRGHLAPAADMGWSEQSMHESFYYSNMSPQVPGFNRGIWKHLEEQVRQWAIDNQSIYVVTGPLFSENLPTIGTNKVSVPRYYFKVLLDYSEPSLKAIGFIIPNASSELSLRVYAVSIDSVEKVTGLDFFPVLPDVEENRIEKTLCVDCWSWTTTSTRHSKSQQTHLESNVVQCSGITQASERCKRMTSNPSGRCKQHDE